MPNWISITIETLNEASVAALIEACDSAALGDGQPNRAAGIIQGVVNEVRDSIAACKKNSVDSDLTTIPKGLRDLAVDLITARLKKAIKQPLTDDEARDVKWRRDQLADIQICKGPSIDQPDNAVQPEVQSGGRMETVTKSERVATREKLDGLL